MKKQKHVPVMSQEVLAWLNPKKGESYLDLTAGYGGHARLIKDKIGPNGLATLVDRDEEAIEHLRKVFADEPKVEVIRQDFMSASRELLAKNRQYDMILADLGVSSPHLDNPDRGFSFNYDGPLDMRMDRNQKLTASEIINTYDEAELAELLYKYGEIRNARRLAQFLIEHRPYKSTSELAKKIVQFQKFKRRIHPATQVFQALRIGVNDELGQLQQSLNIWIELLADGGRIGVISFHSLEDRLVKQAFRDHGGNRYDARLHIATKKAVIAGKKEVVFNPRARSAKLRSAQRK